MLHPDAPMIFVGNHKYLAAVRERFEMLRVDFDPDPLPSLDELSARCRDMGLVLCTCRSVERDGRRVLIHDPACIVHNKLFGRVT